MNKLIHYIALCSILFTACSKEDAAQNSPVSPDDEGVEVILNLVPQAIQAPAPTTKSSAGNGNPNVLASSREGAISLELLAGQPDAVTRAGEVDESAIDNLWILQFNGTGNDATLVKKIYKTDLPNNPNLRFIPGNNVKQRIVVLANTFDPTLDNTLTEASKYSDLSALINQKGTTINGFIPMSGILDTDITANSEPIQTFTVPLKRNVAKITLKVKLADGYPLSTWTAQMCNIAPDYWFPSSGTEVFPAITGDNTYPDMAETNFNFTTADAEGYTTLTWLVPVNRRGTVESTTGIDRKKNAPTGATYIKLAYVHKNDFYQFARTYYIHLGANFTTDYNVCGNTHYTYKVTLYPEADEDSRIEEIVIAFRPQYVGMFGGELKETSINSNVWQFTQELWVQAEDEATNVSWVTTNDTQNLYLNGKSNTFDNKDLANSPLQKCFQKNPNYGTINSVDNTSYYWYLPATAQLMGVWVTTSGKNDSMTNFSGVYWSSSQYYANGDKSGCYINFGNGYMHFELPDIQRNVRCVIEKKKGETIEYPKE